MTYIATIVRDALVNTRTHLPEITDETSFARDLRCDAVDMVCIELAVSDACEIELPACRFEQCETIGDLATLVEQLGRRAA